MLQASSPSLLAALRSFALLRDACAVFIYPTPALASIGDETLEINPLAYSMGRVRKYPAEQRPDKHNHLVLAYTATSGGCHVVLRGIDEYKDSPYVVLDWVDRKYTLFGVYVVG